MKIRTAWVVFFLGAGMASAAPAPWLEIRSPHFTVLTNSGEKEGRRTLWQFEQVRQALLVIWPWAVIDGGKPTEIYAVRDEATLRSLGPQYWEGKQYRPTSFWVGGADRQFIALRTDLPEPDDIGENPYQTAYWNYVSLVFHRSLPGRAPYWYSRGVADVLSNTIAREKEIHVGRLMNNRLRSVRESPLIPMNEFLAADARSRYGTREVEAWQFDAQAWAFVHFLMFSNRGEHQGRVSRFNKLLLEGTDADVALAEAFGPDMTPYFAGMREYIKRDIFQYARIPVALEVRTDGFSSRPLTPAESAVSRAAFLVAMSRPVEARALSAEAAKADPSSPGPAEIEGALQDRERNTAGAKAAYERAASLGSKQAQIYFRLAQMARPDGASLDEATRARMTGHLEKAIALAPDFANALAMLADLRSDAGDSSGIDLAQRAVRADPAEAYHRLTLARAFWNAHRPDEAIAAAQGAMSVAENDEQRGYVRRFLEFTARAPRPAVVQPPKPISPPLPSPVASDTTVPSAAATPTPAPVVVRVDPGAARIVDSCISDRNDAACAQAIPLLQAQCVKGEGYACRAAGSLYDGGFGIPMDKMKAASVYDAGCRLNDAQSCARYAVLQVQGAGIVHDSVAGLATLERLCSGKISDACIGLALILAGRPEKRDLPRARALLKAECDRHEPEACRLLKALP